MKVPEGNPISSQKDDAPVRPRQQFHMTNISSSSSKWITSTFAFNWVCSTVSTRFWMAFCSDDTGLTPIAFPTSGMLSRQKWVYFEKNEVSKIVIVKMWLSKCDWQNVIDKMWLSFCDCQILFCYLRTFSFWREKSIWFCSWSFADVSGPAMTMNMGNKSSTYLQSGPVVR